MESIPHADAWVAKVGNRSISGMVIFTSHGIWNSEGLFGLGSRLMGIGQISSFRLIGKRWCESRSLVRSGRVGYRSAIYNMLSFTIVTPI